MKVLHLNEHLSWSGGIETYLLSLVPLLESLGHSQVVGFATGNGELVANSRRVPLLGRSDRAAQHAGYREVAKMIARERPDIVHVHNIHNTGVLSACLNSVPTILHGHDYRYHCPASTFYFRGTESICERTCGPACFVSTIRGRCMSLRPPYVWSYYQRARFVAEQANRFALAIGNSGYMRDRFIGAGFPAGRVTTLPYFCPLDPLDAPRPLPAEPTILFIGRARPNKGYRYFVEALGQLPKTVRGIMVGDFSGDSSVAVRRLAEKSGCADRLELRSWAAREAIREIYEAATVTVVPSVWAEPLGIVGLESLACGVPVVASDVGGVREWLLDGETGRLVPVKNAAAIARAVSEILESPDSGRRLGENGCELIRTKFSVKRHVDDLLAWYQSLIAQPGLVHAHS
jgi:glycosyltransferase involved in cell wall biosynthesis